MSGQIVDTTLIGAPRQRNTEDEKAQIYAGKAAKEILLDHPAKAAQKDTQARWNVKFTKAKPTRDSSKPVDIAIPTFGYKSRVSIDRRHGIIRRQKVTDAAAHDDAQILPKHPEIGIKPLIPKFSGDARWPSSDR